VKWNNPLTFNFLLQASPEYLREDTITLPVQFNGKTRGTIQVAVGIDQAAAFGAVMEDANFAKFLQGKDIKKTIDVPGRILNLIVK
jgi:leucyl-tRNA synthetase